MSSTSPPLQSSSTVEELIEALQQIVASNDPCDRSEGNVSIILTSKIQLISNNRTNQNLLQALGEFFLWMMPNTESLTSAEREAEKEEHERGRKICSRKDLEDLFVRLLLPFAKSSDAIYSLCRSVGRIALQPNNIYFVTAVARDELLKLVENAPCEKSLQWALQAIFNLAGTPDDDVPIESNPFVCDEVSTVVYKLFCDSTVPKIVQIAADILTIHVEHSTPQFCTTDPDFAQKMLHKLDQASETEATWSIANLVGFVLFYKKQCNIKIFGSGAAARVFLSKLNSSDDPDSKDLRVIRQICFCISNVKCDGDKISDDFASPEMCRAIFNCFSKQKDEFSKDDIFRSIAALTQFLPRARSTFVQECPDLTQAIIETFTSATDDKTRYSVAGVVANISLDAESAKLLFNNVVIYDALIHAAACAQDEQAKNEIIRAMNNATSVCTDFLPLCAARYPFYDEKHIELLKLDNLYSLVSNLENNQWEFESSSTDFLQLRSVLLVLEKIDQFLEVLDKRIEEGDARIEEMLLTIAEGFEGMVQTCWDPLLLDPFLDVTLSLLERSSGTANVIFVNVFYWIVTTKSNFTIHPSTVLRLLQKLDNSKELNEREDDCVKMDFDIYEILETVAIRSPELFRDSNFLVDNSALIRSCFERSFEIHNNDASHYQKSEFDTGKMRLTSLIEALYKLDSRMKEKMEFNY